MFCGILSFCGLTHILSHFVLIEWCIHIWKVEGKDWSWLYDCVHYALFFFFFFPQVAEEVGLSWHGVFAVFLSLCWPSFCTKRWEGSYQVLLLHTSHNRADTVSCFVISCLHKFAVLVRMWLGLKCWLCSFCVCVCVCVCARVHVCVHACMHACMHQTCLPLWFCHNSYRFRPQILLLCWLGKKSRSLSDFPFPTF